MEADRFSEFVGGRDFTVFGLGLGYHIEALIRKGYRDFTVVEPSPKIFKAFLQTGDREEILRKVRIKIGLNAKDLFGKKLFYLPSMKRLYKGFLGRIERTGRITVKNKAILDIVVVGAIYGGTVPIAGYVADAFSSLGHRVILLNFEDFYPALRYIKRFSSNKGFHRILLDKLTNLLGDLIFMKVAEVKPDLLFALAQSPIPPKIVERIREENIVTAYWFTEDYQVMGYWRDIAPFYDFFLTVQEDNFYEELERMGVDGYFYLPMACSPKVHKPLDLTPDDRKRYGSDVSFVGAGYYNRRNFFKSLADLENFKIWGSEWDGCWELQDKIQEGGRRVSTEECVKIFNASKININLHSSPFFKGINPYGDYVNPRTFEIAACGAFQLVDPRKKLEEFFEEGKEIVVFHSEEELRALIKHFLKKEDERIEIALSSREKAVREHSYEVRMSYFLDLVFERFGERFCERKGLGNVPDDLRDVVEGLEVKRVKNITPELLLKEMRKEGKLEDREIICHILDEIWREGIKKRMDVLWEVAGRFS